MRPVDSSRYGLDTGTGTGTGTAEVSGTLDDDVLRAGGRACDARYVEYDPGRGHRAVDVPLGLDGGRKDLP
ncbi:MAG: hypothetical protein FWE15_20180, partial [Actinomycetia bacterium]|nr:hypothetical protein [Actinomycetes bacterium]